MKRLNLLTLRTISLPVVVVIFSLAMAACAPSQAASSNPGSGLPETGGSSVQNPGSGLPETGGSSVQVADNQSLGQILVTPDGKTLYTFAIDTPGVSKCTNVACVTYWPPYTVDAQPTAGSGVPGALSTSTRSNGSTQVTYNGSPLYTFALDKNPGDAKGDGLNQFGGVWRVVSVGNAPGNTSGGSNSAGGSGG